MATATNDLSATVNFARDFGNDVGRDIAIELQRKAAAGELSSDAIQAAFNSVLSSAQTRVAYEPDNDKLIASLRDFANGDYKTPQEILGELRDSHPELSKG